MTCVPREPAINVASRFLHSPRRVVTALLVGLVTAAVQVAVTSVSGHDVVRAVSASVDLAAAAPQDAFCTDGIRLALGLTVLMPLYMVILSAVTKPLVNFLVFGPPRLKTKEKYTLKEGLIRDSKVILRLVLICLMLWTIVHDIRRTSRVATDHTLSAWERWNLALASLAVSPNIAASFAARGLDDLFKCSTIFLRHHGNTASQSEHTIQSNGGLFVIYQSVLMYVYTPLSIFLLGWALLAAVAYFYVTAAIAGVLLVACIFCDMVTARRSKVTDDSEAGLLSCLTDQEKIECMKDLTNQSSKHTVEAYELEREYMERLGAPKAALSQYFLWPIMFGPLPQILVMIALRFYSGCGYWPTLVETWEDRHFVAYAEGIWNKTIPVQMVVWAWI